MTERLGALSRVPLGGDATERELRAVLYGLYAVVKLPFAKEDDVYFRVLDERLGDIEAAALFEAMEDVAGEAKPAA